MGEKRSYKQLQQRELPYLDVLVSLATTFGDDVNNPDDHDNSPHELQGATVPNGSKHGLEEIPHDHDCTEAPQAIQ